MSRGAFLVMSVAARDFWHERWVALCAVLGLAAVLAPLLVLFGLKHGIVTSLIDDLKSRPEIRRIQPLGQGSFDADWFQSLSARSETGFLIPTTRYLSATIELIPADGGRPVRAEMVPSAQGDPLWPDSVPEGGAVLSTSLAEKLGVGQGQGIQARLGRVVDGQPQAARMSLNVMGILPLDAAERDLLLVPLSLLEESEDYREGRAVLRRGWPGNEAERIAERRYASFRLYASDIDGVRRLRDHLAALGVETETAADRILMARRLDNALTVLFLVVSSLAIGGYGLSLALSLAVTVARKQQDISVLKMVGAGNGAVALFPITQAVLTGLLGSLIAVAAQAGAEPLINALFAGGLRDGQVVSRLLPEHMAAAILGTVLLAAAAAAAAGLRAARLPPAEGLRHD